MHKLFGTDGIRGMVNAYPMEPELVLRLGLAAGCFFRGRERPGAQGHKFGKRFRPRVVIGKDTRLSGYIFETALTAGFCASGLDVFQVGPLPTPAIAFLTRNMRADFGVVISASHNPYHDNGIKFFDSEGFKLPDSVEDEITGMVLDRRRKWNLPTHAEVGRAGRINDALGRYIVALKNSVPEQLTLEGLKVVLDCANGAAYKVAPMALEELGAEVIKIGTEPDGLNINAGCGSLHPEVAAEKVLAYGADVGIALDGDADRVILADETGRILDGDQIMAICAQDLLHKGVLPGKKLAATVMSNMALEVFMRERGGELVRAQVGDRYVVEAMRNLGIALGGEQSGHMIFMRHSTTGDGLLTGLQVLRIMRESGKKLSGLARLLDLYPQKLLNVRVREKKPFEAFPEIIQARSMAEKQLAGRGRVLLRYSGTEPLARVMIEGENEHKVEYLCKIVADAVHSALNA